MMEKLQLFKNDYILGTISKNPLVISWSKYSQKEELSDIWYAGDWFNRIIDKNTWLWWVTWWPEDSKEVLLLVPCNYDKIEMEARSFKSPKFIWIKDWKEYIILEKELSLYKAKHILSGDLNT